MAAIRLLYGIGKRSFATTTAIPTTVSIPIGEEKCIKLETGRLAKMADGCAVCEIGNTAVMVTAVSRTRSSPVMGFVPLTVDYRQKAAAAGRIPTNLLRRELGANDVEILTSRLIDRSIRVLFPKGYTNDTQLICNVLAADAVHDPDVAAINAASAALTISDIPWNGPVGAVRIGIVDGELVLNPTRHQIHSSCLNMVVTGASNQRLLMLEMSGSQIPPADVVDAVRHGLAATERIVNGINSLRQQLANAGTEKPKRPFDVISTNQALMDAAVSLVEGKVRDIFRNYTFDKIGRDKAITEVRQTAMASLKNAFPDEEQWKLEEVFGTIIRDLFRKLIFEENRRCDGRELTDLRPIECSTGLYKPLHGSAMFQRGQTQVLCTVTFDAAETAFRNDPVSVLTGAPKEKPFLLHYEFPPYATNEIGSLGGRNTGRRELGHGALAEKALRAVLPADKSACPFTIRLTSEVLESNGSSSMASVCGGTLALLDAGVKMKSSVSGVAVGLVTRPSVDGEANVSETDYRLLTDILGIEDYMGDMDFKIAGSRRGLTAMQLDLKIPGISSKILSEAVDRATDANDRILNIMENTLAQPRDDQHRARRPVVEKLVVPPAKRQRLVGVGGVNLRRLEAEVGIRVTQIDDTSYRIFAPDSDAWAEAKERIESLLSAPEDVQEADLEFGCVYTAKIVEMRDSGVLVQIFQGMTPAMVPNRQLDLRKVNHPSALGLNVGQTIQVKYFGRDATTGQMLLSRKVLQQIGEPKDSKNYFEAPKSSASSPWASKRVSDSSTN